MKKTVLTIVFIACFIVTKAQIITPQISKTDTINTLDAFAKYLQQHPVLSPLTGSNLNSLTISNHNTNKTSFILSDKLLFKGIETVAEKMPVAKVSSVDRMPILKLGDTETTHFTMLIKPVATTTDTKNITRP